jgi:murein DD-endopeptidase MepM/ murein hydrolase activator NlpD
MIRPVDAEISQRYGDNPTKYLPADHWLIKQFGNYQPDGHSGEDYACKAGTPVRAVTDGTVLHIGWMGGTYADNPWWIMPSFAGYVAVIDHGSFIGIYGHCKDGSAKVSKGDRVTEGQVFVLSGNTGASTGDHLHFEILPDRYVLQSTMYGRTDPEALFSSSLSYASESIKILPEDDVSAQEVMSWPLELKDGQTSNVATQLVNISADISAALQELKAIKGQTEESMLNDRKQVYSLEAIQAAPPAQIAADINAAGLAEAVRDELVKLLSGKP